MAGSMTLPMPPELMSADEREAREVEIQREISREWLRFVVTEAVVLWIPLAIFLFAYVTTDAVPDGALLQFMVAGGAVCVGLVLYWVTRRIQPLQRELEKLKRHEGF